MRGQRVGQGVVVVHVRKRAAAIAGADIWGEILTLINHVERDQETLINHDTIPG